MSVHQHHLKSNQLNHSESSFEEISFSDVVGMELAKQALMLLAIDPMLGGVVIPASVGSGKSTLARAFAQILPKGTPFVELPLGATEDRIIGGLDLEAAIATGARIIEKGLLAKAHHGVLYVDSLNLLDSSASAHIMDAMSRGKVIIEREGVSESHEAEFMLVGTYNPSEGDVRMGLLDRIGMIVPFSAQSDASLRAEVVRRVSGKKKNADTSDELEMLSGLVSAGRAFLPKVSIRDEEIEGLVQAALSLGIEGNRADILAQRAAMASAALAGRFDVEEEDLKLATKLVILPRATRVPEEESENQEKQKQEEPPKPDEPQNKNEDEEDDSTDEDKQSEQTPDQIEELLLDSIEADLPDSVMNLALLSKKQGSKGSRGYQLNYTHGRFIRAEFGSLKKGKLALVPTLLNASPWQKSRKADLQKKKRAYSANVVIQKDDIRIKRFRDKAGTLFTFIVDASGSMALNRMREAKGAITRLLQNAYINRDQIALIAFRGKQAELLLPPSQSVDRAKRALDVLPTGGGTPLASAMLLGWQTSQQMRSKGISQSMLVMITDGRGNIPLRPIENETPDKAQLADELTALAASIRADGVGSVVIDTQMSYVSRGDGQKLAAALGAKYVYLPNAKAEHIVAAIQ